MAEPDNSAKPERVQYTWAAFARDQLAKGNLPLTFLAVIVFIYLWRIPPERLYGLPGEIFEAMQAPALGVLGWVLAAITLLFWHVHTRYIDFKHKAENKRLGVENTRLHRQLMQQATHP